MFATRKARARATASALALLGFSLIAAGAPADHHQSAPFHGAKVNGGTVACSQDGERLVLTLSDDFVIPDTPAPHWQVVDSKGRAHLLQRLKIKGDVEHRAIVVPSYVADVAKVQIWCAWAEVLLGETDLVCRQPVAPPRGRHVEALATREGVKHESSAFEGVKANRGYVTHTLEKGKSVLVLSDDFVVPDTPAPHWQIVDSDGRAYLLNRLVIKGDKLNGKIQVPSFVPNVAKVQIWCAFAETLLGEASFETPVM